MLALLQENDLKCDSQLASNAFLTYALILWKQIKPGDKCTTQNIPAVKGYKMLLRCQIESLVTCLSTNTLRVRTLF